MGPEQLKFFTTEHKPAKKGLLLSLDTLFFSLSVAILLIIFSYILGIERGKNIARVNQHLIPNESGQMLASQTQDKIVQVENEESYREDSLVSDIAREGEIIREEHKKVATEETLEKYVIQVASYKNMSFAQKESKVLQARGYPTIITQKGNYVVLFVGEYSSQREAKNKMQNLKDRYKDCFVRRL
jgi:hypothetical protein